MMDNMDNILEQQLEAAAAGYTPAELPAEVLAALSLAAADTQAEATQQATQAAQTAATAQQTTQTTPAPQTPQAASQGAQSAQAPKVTMPSDRDGIISAQADTYLASISITIPDLLDPASDIPDQIRGDILSQIRLAIELENQARAGASKLKCPEALPGYIVARILMRTGDVRTLVTGTSGHKLVAKQYHREAGAWKWSGTYGIVDTEDNTSQVMMIFQRLCPNGTKQDLATLARELCKAPRAYLQNDDKLVWFRNGVWDYRRMALTEYDDSNFDRLYPTQICLGKLPVYHPYGHGAVLKPDADDVVAEPVICNADGTTWHPGQMLTDPFDMASKEGQASSQIIWQAMQFMLRRLNGAPGLYHFWVNANGRGHNGKSAIWAMMQRLLTKRKEQGDDDLHDTTQRVIPASVEELDEPYALAQHILTAYAIVGEESNSGSGTTYVDRCATAKMLARGQEMPYRVIYGKPFNFTFKGLLLQQSNKAPIFAEKNDSIVSHTVVIRFERSFDDSRPYIKDDYVLREDVAEWLAYQLTVERPCLECYDADALRTLEPNKREMLTESMPSLRFLDEVVPSLHMRVMPLELMYELYIRWCDMTGEKEQSMRVLRDDLQQWANNNSYGVDFFAQGRRVRTDMDDLRYVQEPLADYRETRKHGRNKFCDPRAWGLVAPDKARQLAGALNVSEMCYVDDAGKPKPRQWNKGGLIRTTPWQTFAQQDN